MTAQAPIPLDGATTNQTDGVNGQWPCDLCERAFPTKNGLGQHKRRSHTEEANNAINVERVRSRWSDEEVRMMARSEATAMNEGVANMNQYLLTQVPNRTLEAIKSRRKNPGYKQLVVEMSRTEPSETEASPENVNTVEPADCEFDGAINEGMQSLEGDNRRCIRVLVDYARRLVNGEEDSVNLSQWTKSLCPGAKPPKGPCYRWEVVVETNAKRRRRQEYAELQKMYHKDFGSAVRQVLTDKGSVEMPPVDEVLEYWRSIFESPVNEEEQTVAHRSRPGNLYVNLWQPVTIDEVKACELNLKSAPGIDGISVENWRKIDSRARTLFFNMILKQGKLDPDLKMARTVLIPKGIGKITAGNTRPLSITSVAVRHLHKILANRFKKVHNFSDCQKAFIDVDGTQENLSILNTILAEARKARRTVHIATLDLRKAFDSVTHKTILETLELMGCPEHFVSYIKDLYTNAKTMLQYDLTANELNIRKGVLQGDPLSPLLFNAVMDRAIKKLPSEVGFSVHGVTVNCIAYADDVILVATTQQGLQTLINTFTSELDTFGLKTNADKSSTLSLVASGKEKKMKVVGTPTFKVGDVFLNAIGVMDVWKYLGVEFKCINMNDKELGIGADLARIDKAPLKPQQRLRMLRSAVIPKYLHVLLLGRVTKGKLQAIDRLVRAHVRKWIYLPKDSPLAYFYADIRSGGLGIPILEQQVPFIRKKRLSKFVNKANELSTAFRKSDYLTQQLRWCDGVLRDIGVDVTQESVYWENKLYDMVDTNDLKESKGCSASSNWLGKWADQVSGQDFIHYNHIRVGCLPSKARTSRGQTHDRRCRAGCRVSETNHHVIQTCHRTHGGRVLRHDRVVNLIEQNLIKRNGWRIKKEAKIKTSVGLRKPDLLITKDGATKVLDVQIVSGRNMATDHRNKIHKYQSIPNFDEMVKKICGSRTVSYEAVTISYKGLLGKETYKALKKLGMNERFIFVLSTSVLRGTWLNWNQFNKSTASTLWPG